jgi:hypothetical protein
MTTGSINNDKKTAWRGIQLKCETNETNMKEQSNEHNTSTVTVVKVITKHV